MTTEISFTSVNASQTVATTSFVGYAKAGTTIEVTPHISDRDQLQLDFKVSLNDFQGSPARPLPEFHRHGRPTRWIAKSRFPMAIR